MKETLRNGARTKFEQPLDKMPFLTRHDFMGAFCEPTLQQLTDVCQQNQLTSVNVCSGTAHAVRSFGYHANPETSSQQIDASRYLIASITKPIVAMAALKLAAEGCFTLQDRLGKLLPRFSKAAFRRISVRNLLTHTSGFPDMLPDNAELRAAHASLQEFAERAAEIDLDFSTASDCRYSSVGFLLLGQIIEQVTGDSLSGYLRTQFFEPLGMQNTWLGIPNHQAEQLLPTVLPSILPVWQPDAEDWGWNSRYWRTLGAPWGGMISTAEDLSRFAAMMLSDGCSASGTTILPPAVVHAALQDQTTDMARSSDFTGASRPWTFGWRKQWPAHAASFGDFVDSNSIGHWGATGTLLWIDPTRGRYAVILTTTPYEDSQTAIQRISNVVSVSDI